MTATRRTPLRAVLRFVASVLIVSGVLLIADAGITVTWQEPISAYLAGRDQARLERELRDPPARVRRREPLPGDAIGKIELPSIGKAEFVVEGTDLKNLREGPGHYPKTPMPGQRGTTAIAGHRTTYGAPFRNIDDLRNGDAIRLEMPYGTFVYRVERTRIVPSTELSVTRRVSYDRLVLTACHPLHSAKQRIVVYAKLARRERPRIEA